MADWLNRTEKLLGRGALERLAACRVTVVGLGGVGGHAAEALLRSGIGVLRIVDGDAVDETNLNRQLVASRNTVGMPKTQAMVQRLRSICPDARLEPVQTRIDRENMACILSGSDYVVDAVDDMDAKVGMILWCRENGVPLICSMGAGNRLDPTAFRVMDLSKTQNDPLAKALRQRMRREGVNHQKVVCSMELPVKTGPGSPASIAFVPAAAGLALASAVVRDLLAANE